MINLAKIEESLNRFSICRRRAPAAEDLVVLSESILQRKIPTDYRRLLLEISNGIGLTELRLLPVEDKTNRRNLAATWDSVTRNNRSDSCAWFDRDDAAFDEFFVFAASVSTCFAIRYSDPCQYVWVWTAGGADIIELDYMLDDSLFETAEHER